MGEMANRSGGPSWRRPALLALGAAVVAGIVYLSTLDLGGAAPAAPDASSAGQTTGIAVGQHAPEFSSSGTPHPLVDLDGHPVHIADFRGKPLWIVFWATWCTPCQEEAPEIRATFDQHRADGLVVLAIDVQEPPAAVRDYVQRHELDYMIGLDASAEVKERYGGWGLPVHYFVDADGVIRGRYIGQLTRPLMEEQLKAILPS